MDITPIFFTTISFPLSSIVFAKRKIKKKNN